MKTQLIDFILSTLVLGLLAGLDLLLMVYVFNPVVVNLFGYYAIIINVLLALVVFGLLSALFLKVFLSIWPFVPGRYSMNDPLFTRWKLFTVVYEFGRGALLPVTTIFSKPLVAKLFGAKIGKDIALGGHLVDQELITIGDEAIIGQGSVVTGHTITSGELILNPVIIGPRATVGVNAVVMSGVEIGEESVITAGSVVPPDTQVPPRELWGGIPAKKIKDV